MGYYFRHPLPLLVLLYGTALLGGLYLFAQLAEGIHTDEGLCFDERLLDFFATQRTEFLDYFFRLVTWMGSLYLLIPSGMMILFILLCSNQYKAAVLLGVGFGGAIIITYIAKFMIARPRPGLFPRLIEPWGNMAFPSAHTTQVTAFMMALLMIVRRTRPEWQPYLGIIAILLIAAVATSRIYLQVHYPSDVLAGLVLAVLWIWGIDRMLGWQGK